MNGNSCSIHDVLFDPVKVSSIIIYQGFQHLRQQSEITGNIFEVGASFFLRARPSLRLLENRGTDFKGKFPQILFPVN